jgi:RNA-directed DNA polymerase
MGPTRAYACATQAGPTRLGSHVRRTSRGVRRVRTRRATLASLLPWRGAVARSHSLEGSPQKPITIPGSQLCSWHARRVLYQDVGNFVGSVLSPLLSHLYLTEVDRMLERAKEVTRRGKYPYLAYARFADDLVIVVDAYRDHAWLLQAVDTRLRQEWAILHVVINEEKSRIVDVAHGATFSFLGFDCRRVKSRSGVWRPWYTPMQKKRTALLRKLQEIFRRSVSQPVDRVIALINPILRGWVRYCAVGDSSRCFGCIKDGVAKKVRRHLMRARNRKGFGWQRWSRRWLYGTLRLFHHSRVSRPQPKALPAREVP